MPTPAAPKPQCQPTRSPRITRDERRDERADVDPHVEDREACVASRAAFRIQIADESPRCSA